MHTRNLVLAAVLAASGFVAPTFADGESLAETGGYVPTDAPALAFKNITLADLGTTAFPSATKGGAWAGGEAKVPLVLRNEETSDGSLSAITYQAQWNDGGYLKCAKIRFTNGEGGVYAQTVDAKYTGTGVPAAYLTDFSGTQAYCAASATDNGYGFCNLQVHQKSELDSISINFNDAESTKLWTSDPVGLNGYAVGGMLWSQMPGTNGSTLPSVTAIGDDGSEFYAAAASQVRISGTRGTWAWSGYTAASDVRYGYIDEDIVNSAPAVTVTDIPFNKYKVIVYCSTDTEDAQFGHVTINGVNYTSSNKEKASSGEFSTEEGTDAWGKARVQTSPINGVNCLVSPATSAKTLTVVGHRESDKVRGCIAAIQIVKTDETPSNEYLLELTDDVEWSSLTDFTGGEQKVVYVNNDSGDATITFDTAVQSAMFVLSGSGTTTLQFNEADYNRISSFDFAAVTGEVAIDDVIREANAFAPPLTGTLHYKGTATLTTAPNNSGTLSFGVIVDQPMSMDEFQLAGVKPLYGFGPNCNATFASRFVLGNNTGSNQTVTQYGGSISVNGSAEPSEGNMASVLLAHWGSLTVNFNTFGGTFTAVNAASRLGHTGKCYWTIGDGVSESDSIAVVNIKGLACPNFNTNVGRGSKVVIQQGGTLNLGESGIVLPDSSVEFAGGKLATASENSVSVSASSIAVVAGTDTELNTVNGLAINSAISGSGNLTKTGSGTLTLSVPASASGTLTVEAGTLSLDPGVVWAGEISLGENGTLDIVDNTIDESSTLYIPVGRALTVGSGTVKLNGTALNTEVWELSGGTLVNKTLKNATTTATGDISFSTSTWNDALGDSIDVDWSGYLSEVRVSAANAEPATVTVDVNAAQVKDFVVEGPGDVVIVSTDDAGISAQNYDFSSASGRVEYTLPVVATTVASGANTVLSGGGAGTPVVGAGKTLTLGPWGENGDDTTYTCGMFRLAAGSTLIFAPGEGKIQKSGGFGDTNSSTTIGVTNGTLAVNMSGGNDSVFFGANSVRIDNGGILSLEAQDALGYYYARSITINNGGVLSVKVRDTLKRTANMNGGTIEVQGENSGRALDFYSGNIINVTADSTIQAVDDGSVANPTIWFRNGTTIINIDDAVALANNVTYESTSDVQSQGSVTIRGTMNNGNGNGSMVMNGFNGNPLTFTGTATIGESGKPVMYVLNCEHKNGTYVVNAASRLMGSGTITGNGGVTLAAANSKICGSLDVNKVVAPAGGTFGDQWNAVEATISGSFAAAGTVTIENGSLTIGAECALDEEASVTTGTGDSATTTTTTGIGSAAFSIAANGKLRIAQDIAIAGLSVADGGTIDLLSTKTGAPEVTVTGTATYAGTVNIVLDFGDAFVPAGFKAKLPAGLTADKVVVSDANGQRKWRVTAEADGLYATSNGGFSMRLR